MFTYLFLLSTLSSHQPTNNVHGFSTGPILSFQPSQQHNSSILTKTTRRPTQCRVKVHPFVKNLTCTLVIFSINQGVSLTGHNTTGTPSRAAAWWVTLCRREVLQTTMTDANEQNNTGPPTLCVCGPVIVQKLTLWMLWEMSFRSCVMLNT